MGVCTSSLKLFLINGFGPVDVGTGKTLTAGLHGPSPPEILNLLTPRTECVAEEEQRPLYAISCGDLGTEPEQLEMRLKEVFDRAVAWKAVLLRKYLPMASHKTEERKDSFDRHTELY